MEGEVPWSHSSSVTALRKKNEAKVPVSIGMEKLRTHGNGVTRIIAYLVFATTS